MKKESNYLDTDDIYADIIRELKAQNAELLAAAKSAISALSQNAVFPADIAYAKKVLLSAIEKAEKQ